MSIELRKHQTEALEIAKQIGAGVCDQKVTCAYVTPGGGKTLLASLFAHELIRADDVDHVLIVCPRENLQEQMRDGFTVPELGLDGGLQIGPAGQRALFSRERAGTVTTYQALVANAKPFLRAMKKDRWLLVLDESHHLPAERGEVLEESGWTRVVSKLVESAKRVLLMTGTMGRDDRAPLAFLDYDMDRNPRVDVRYTRRQALEERAVLNVSVELCDGEAKYWHRYSKHEHKLSQVSAAEESRALRTLLHDPAYRDAVLTEAVRKWEAYRTDHNTRARMIVICESVQAARIVRRYLRDHHAEWTTILATSKEVGARNAIRRFRVRREGEILVTCQMAYEGLDVPDCTHLVCLTNIRSRPWLEQAFARVTRFDREARLSWEDQSAFLYVPNDPSMVSFLSEWLDEQDGRFDDPTTTGAMRGVTPRTSTFSPDEGELTDVRFAGTYGIYAEPDQRRIRLFRQKFPSFACMPNKEILKVARETWPNDDHPLLRAMPPNETTNGTSV